MLLGTAGALTVACGAASGQGAGTLSGIVTLADVGEGVPGVRISLAALGLTAYTDEQGRVAFQGVPPGPYEAHAEIVGCRPLVWTVDVPDSDDLVVALELDGPAMRRTGPTVVAGVAGDTPERNLAFTVERLEREQIARDPARSIADLIRGAFPGVKVVQGSGTPGSRLSIQFRGPHSISGAQEPLVVIDGMITGGGLEELDPAAVERIEVLKGSAAAAAYGARGQAGVLEITTQGRAGAAAAGCFLRMGTGT